MPRWVDGRAAGLFLGGGGVGGVAFVAVEGFCFARRVPDFRGVVFESCTRAPRTDRNEIFCFGGLL